MPLILVELTVGAAVGIGILSTNETLTNRISVIAPIIIVRVAILIHGSPVFTCSRIGVPIPKHRRITSAESTHHLVTVQKPSRITVRIFDTRSIVETLESALVETFM